MQRTLSSMLHWSMESYRGDSHRVNTTKNSMVNAVKNFLKNMKYFVFKNTMLFVKILIMIKIGTNNFKCFYFIIIILHSISVEKKTIESKI